MLWFLVVSCDKGERDRLQWVPPSQTEVIAASPVIPEQTVSVCSGWSLKNVSASEFNRLIFEKIPIKFHDNRMKGQRVRKDVFNLAGKTNPT